MIGFLPGVINESAMDPDFWHARWREGQIGFHRTEVNPWLREYLPTLGLAAGARILVPLCGKSLDLGWLAQQGLRPVGVELSPIACAAVFEEGGIAARRSSHAGFDHWHGGGIEVWCGDFLAPSLAELGPFEALWDRAALIALPAETRPRYVEQCAHLLVPGAPGLLVSLEYDPAEMDGPPFSVSAAEVEALYRVSFELEPLVLRQYAEPSPHLAARGLTGFHESVWRLRRHDPGDQD